MSEELKTANIFEKLNAINVNEHTEKKDNLTYLSWAWAWAAVKKVYPTATYEVKKNENGLPYVYDKNTGYMVFTSVTIEDLTYEMWLPVMDNNNRAMKDEPYTVKTKYKDIVVKPATMFDVNKAIMRCLVKNLAMFGLGLYIYAGEDLPESGDETGNGDAPFPEESGKITPDKVKQLETLFAVYPKDNRETTKTLMLKDYGAESLSDLTTGQFVKFRSNLTDEAEKMKNTRIAKAVEAFAAKSGLTDDEARASIETGINKKLDEIMCAEFPVYYKQIGAMIKGLGK